MAVKCPLLERLVFSMKIWSCRFYLMSACGGFNYSTTKASPGVFCGSTPLNKLSIGMHANIVLRNRHSTPHVTIFWKFWWHKLLKQRLNFNLSLLWWCRSRILFEIQASEQRHRLFSLAWSPLHHIRPGPEFMRLRSTQIRIQNFCFYLNNDQAILSQFYHK